MPLNSSTLKSQVKSALSAKGFKSVDKNQFPGLPDIFDLSDTLVDLILLHIQTNAIVNTTVNTIVTTTGGPTAQAGSGTGTGIGTVS